MSEYVGPPRFNNPSQVDAVMRALRPFLRDQNDEVAATVAVLDALDDATPREVTS